MTPVRISWVVDGQWLGSRDYEVLTSFIPHSMAFFCPYEGEVWARAIVLPQTGPAVSPVWQTHHAACRKAKHDSALRYQAPGAIPLHFFNQPAYPASEALWLYQAKTLLELWSAGHPALRGMQ